MKLEMLLPCVNGRSEYSWLVEGKIKEIDTFVYNLCLNARLK